MIYNRGMNNVRYTLALSEEEYTRLRQIAWSRDKEAILEAFSDVVNNFQKTEEEKLTNSESGV